MNKEKTIYIVGSVALPDCDAGACRILELSKGFKNYFDKVIIAGKYDGNVHELHSYDDKIYFLPYHTITTKNLFDKLKMIFFPKKEIISDLNRSIEKYNITHIIIYSALNIATVKAIKKIAKKHSIKIIYDVVEFQSLSCQSISSYFSFYLPNIRLNKNIIKNGDNVISISSFLNNCFLSKGCNSVLIPFVEKTDDIPVKHVQKADNFINLVYFGSPKKGKDLLINSIVGISLLSSEIKARVRFLIAGITKDDFVKENHVSNSVLSKLNENVIFLGKISKDKIKEIYQNADYSVLIRDPKKRISKAGFPTKVSESLSYGVPVICNISSDLQNYLVDNENSFILNDYNPEEFAKCISQRVSMVSNTKLDAMKAAARATAERKLDISLFYKSLEKVLY